MFWLWASINISSSRQLVQSKSFFLPAMASQRKDCKLFSRCEILIQSWWSKVELLMRTIEQTNIQQIYSSHPINIASTRMHMFMLPCFQAKHHQNLNDDDASARMDGSNDNATGMPRNCVKVRTTESRAYYRNNKNRSIQDFNALRKLCWNEHRQSDRGSMGLPRILAAWIRLTFRLESATVWALG